MTGRTTVPFGLIALVTVLTGCAAGEQKPIPPDQIPVYTVKIVNTFPHDSTAFTQGLVYDDGYLYEGTGQRGASSLRKVRLETGEVLQRHEMHPSYFGEGIALVDNRLVQLTWTSRTGFVYDKATLEPIDQFRYLTDGWGLTFDGDRLIMSDGTAVLQTLDPQTYEYTGFIQVRAGVDPIQRLNELEYANGEIFANVWPGSRIARIDPETGYVVGWIDASSLYHQLALGDSTDVLNGIAWDAAHDRLFLTGKYWNKLFEVELIPAR